MMSIYPKAIIRSIDPISIIVFQNVTFGYKPEMPVFSEYSFTISEDENVTFVGRTGAGKSTIFRLLTGLYTPQSGQIKVAGIDPAVLAPADRRKLFGIVEQKFHIVPGNERIIQMDAS